MDVPCLSALYVCSDGVKDVAANATTNKVADHANVTTDITTVVEEILHEDKNKAVDSDVIADMTENAVDKTGHDGKRQRECNGGGTCSHNR